MAVSLTSKDNLAPKLTERATGAIAQTGLLNLFTVTGLIQVLAIRGEVTTVIQTQANDTKIVSNPTVGADVDMCAVDDITADAVGTLYSITGTAANPMIATTSGAFEEQANPITVAAGTIDMSCGANNSGEVKWTLLWRPVSLGASVVAA